MRKVIIPSLVLITMLASLSCSSKSTEVIIETEKGNITVEIFTEQAPITARNFLEYVDMGLFKGASFYRTVTLENQPGNDILIEVIQGGRAGMAERAGIEAIAHETTDETGVLHLDGTISMARSKPGTASSEFFICVNDQPSLDFGGLRNPDGQGFAAFGRVISGMDIVRSIQNSRHDGQSLKPVIKILNISRKD